MEGFVGDMLSAFVELMSAPFKSLDSLFYLLPIVLVWIGIELYYDKMDQEKASFGSALAHGVSIFWISIILLKAAINVEPLSMLKIILVVLMLLYAIVVSYLSLLQKIEAKIAHIIAAPNILYLLSIFMVLWINNMISVGWPMVLVLVVLAILCSLLDLLLKKLLPKSTGKGLGGSSGLNGFGKGSKPSSSPPSEGFPLLK